MAVEKDTYMVFMPEHDALTTSEKSDSQYAEALNSVSSKTAIEGKKYSTEIIFALTFCRW